MKIKDVKADQETQSTRHYRQRAKIDKERERTIVIKRNAIMQEEGTHCEGLLGKRWRHGREGTAREKRAE